MEQRTNLLEKALNLFERKSLKDIIIDGKTYPEPDKYIIRFKRFNLVLTHQEHSHEARQSPGSYSLQFVYISTGKKVEEFVEEAENFGRIKAIYDSIRNQLNENYRMQIESDKRKSEEREKIEKEKALKKLERIL
ncbi:MAG: hypothetical protein AABW47_03795 [Nanoarchaeota archaeon]